MFVLLLSLGLTGCGKHESLVQIGDRDQVLRLCDGVEPSDLDPHTAIGQGDYGLESAVRDLNLDAARLARRSADRWTAKEPHKPRFVAGSIGPLNRTLSMSRDVNDPGLYDDAKALSSCANSATVPLSLGSSPELPARVGACS